MQLTSRSPIERQGFTLVELMVTIALLSVLLMAVLPDIGTWMRNLNIKSTSSTLMAGLTTAREQAVRRNRVVRFSLVTLTDNSTMDNSCAVSASGRSWVVSMSDPVGKCRDDVSSTVEPMILAKQVTGDGGMKTTVQSLNAAGGAASWIAFDQFGRVQASPTAITTINIDATTSNSENRPLRIIVSPGGDAHLCDPKVNITGDPRKCPVAAPAP